MSGQILSGIKVVELGVAGVGPWASKLLGGLGADVVKMEDPSGEISHSIPPYIRGLSALYINANLNKRNIVLDLKDRAQHGIALELIRRADVFIENLRPGVVDRLGLGYTQLKAINPNLLMVSACAYGASGPMGAYAGADPFVQAFCGWCSITGARGTRGELLRYLAHIDITAAAVITEALLHALVARERGAGGQHILIEMLTAAMSIQANRISEYFASGEQPPVLGSATATVVPHQAFLCQDRKYLAAGALNEQQWAGFCHAMKLEELASDPRFASNANRVKNRDVLVPLLEERFASRPSAWWAMRLTEQKVPNGYFLDFADLVHHAQVVENEFIQRIRSEQLGEVMVETLPWRFDRTPTAPQRISGGKGAHTDEVLSALKKSIAEKAS